MTPQLQALRTQAAGLLAGLALQYALGMYVNLFVAFPAQSGDRELWQFAWTQWALVSHIILAVGLVIGASVLCIRAFRSTDQQWMWASALGLISILAAAASGSVFVGSQTEGYSYLMALFFLVAAGAYSLALFESRYYTTARP